MYLYFVYQFESIVLRNRNNIKVFLIYNLIFTVGIVTLDPSVLPIGVNFLTSYYYFAWFYGK